MGDHFGTKSIQKREKSLYAHSISMQFNLLPTLHVYLEGKIETFTEQFHKPQLSLPKMKSIKMEGKIENIC